MDGLFVGPHQGDLVRLPLLWKYGGAWMDVGTLLFRHLDEIWWNRIIDPASPCELGGFAVEFREKYYTMLNGFLVCQSGNPFIKRWHDIYLSLWGPDTTNANGFHKHPLLAHIKAIETPSDRVIEDPEMITAVDVMLDYLAHFLCLERLRVLVILMMGLMAQSTLQPRFSLRLRCKNYLLYNRLHNGLELSRIISSEHVLTAQKTRSGRKRMLMCVMHLQINLPSR